MNETGTLENQLQESDDPIVKCELLRQLFRSVMHTDTRKAETYSVEMHRIGTTRSCEKCLAEWNLSQAILLEKRSDYDAAIERFMAALNGFRCVNDQRGVASVMINVGLIFFFRKEYEKAEERYREALNIGLSTKDDYILSRAYANLSNVYTTWEQYDKAIAYYARALKILNALGDEIAYARTLDNIGILYRMSGQHRKAVRCHLRSYKIKLEKGDRENCARTLGNLGNLYAETGENRKAIGYYTRAIEIADELNVIEISKACYGSMAEIYARMGDYKNAFFCQQKFTKLRDDIVNEKSVHLYAEADARLKAAARELDMKNGIYRDLYEKSRGEHLPEGLESLSKREMETLAQLSQGLTDKEIAAKLFVSVATVKTHLRSIYQKLSVRSRSEVIALVHRHHIFG